MAKKKRNISVFIASPGDLTTEREQFRDSIRQLNAGFGDGANIEFEALGWEDTLASTGRRNQSVINAEIDRCDVFFLVLHRRWGQEAPDATPYSSYTEEEFHPALERWREEKSPEIFVFFKRVDAGQEADPGPQLLKVIDFRQQLEETRHVRYRYIGDGENSFLDEVDNHLRAYAKGELNSIDPTKDIIVLPVLAIEEVKKAKEEARLQAQAAEEASKREEILYLKIEEMQLEMAEEAIKFAKNSLVEHARKRFITLVADSSNISVLNLAYNFFYLTGDMKTAVTTLHKWLSLSGSDSKTIETAEAYSYLGYRYQEQGDLNQSEAMYQKSLAISKDLDNEMGIARNYGNLACLYVTQGNLDKAKNMFLKSLEIDYKNGHKSGMAHNYRNLGHIYLILRDLDKAKIMLENALEIDTTHANKDSLIHDYGELGNYYLAKNDLNQAENMYQKSLKISEELGYKSAMACNYHSLGILFDTQGFSDKAEDMLLRSREINEDLGFKVPMIKNYCVLAGIYQTRGDFDKAEELYKKSINIEESLGRKTELAKIYFNLGNLYRAKKDYDQAEAIYEKILAIEEMLNDKKGMSDICRCLGGLYKEKGDPKQAKAMYEKSESLKPEAVQQFLLETFEVDFAGPVESGAIIEN